MKLLNYGITNFKNYKYSPKSLQLNDNFFFYWDNVSLFFQIKKIYNCEITELQNYKIAKL